MKKLSACVVALSAFGAFAQEGSSPWSLTIGPAWRARVKSSISGACAAPDATASRTVTSDRKIEGHGDWSLGEVETVPDPDYPTVPTMRKYAATRTVKETVVAPANAMLDGSDEDRPLGVKANAGYEVCAGERFSLSLNAKFAAYWNMRSSVTGLSGGAMTVRTTKDYYLFSNGPIPNDTDFSFARPDATPFADYQQTATQTTPLQGRAFSARISSDLYQIGLGPRAAWHVCEWLDVYASVEALCNIASLDFDAGVLSCSDTKCRLGFGGNVGASAYLTDNVGLFAEVGYEWIDGIDANVGRAHADVDFSSLVVGVGLALRF